MRYVIKNLARDWSVEGAPERAQSYGRICEELARLFPDRCVCVHVLCCVCQGLAGGVDKGAIWTLHLCGAGTPLP